MVKDREVSKEGGPTKSKREEKDTQEQEKVETQAPPASAEKDPSSQKTAPALVAGMYANMLLKQLSPILPLWKSRRITVTFAIKLPKTKAKRTEYLS